MALLDPTPIINGRRFDFASIEALFHGFRTIGFKAISYKHTLKPGEAYGAAPQMMGTSRGQGKGEGSFEMFKEEFAAFIAVLGPGYKERYFNIEVSYGLPGLAPTLDSLLDVRIVDDEDVHSAGEEPLTVKCSLLIRNVLRNGIPAVLDF